VKPRTEPLNDSDEEIPEAQLGYLRDSIFQGDVLEGIDGEPISDQNSLQKDKVAFKFMEVESDYLESWRGNDPGAKVKT
jgi:hypothetical protein